MAKTPETSVVRDTGIEELTADLSGSPYFSHDMAPYRAGRRWGMSDMAVLWISMSACVPTYMLASGMIEEGMNWWQAVLTIFLGNSSCSCRWFLTRTPARNMAFRFLCTAARRSASLGANVPALLRALVACGWFGIQTWIGGWAIYKILVEFVPAWGNQPNIAWLGINAPQLVCFLLFWAINMLVIYKGIESIRMLLNIKAPLLIVLGLALLAWAYYAAGGFGDMLSTPSRLTRVARRRASSGRSSSQR